MKIKKLLIPLALMSLSLGAITVVSSFKNEEPVVTVPEEIAEKSINAIERMLEASK